MATEGVEWLLLFAFANFRSCAVSTLDVSTVVMFRFPFFAPNFVTCHLSPCFFQASSRVDFSANPMHEASFEFYDQSLLDKVRGGDRDCREFFRLLALCHTVMPEEKNGERHDQLIDMEALAVSKIFTPPA